MLTNQYMCKVVIKDLQTNKKRIIEIEVQADNKSDAEYYALTEIREDFNVKEFVVTCDESEIIVQ